LGWQGDFAHGGVAGVRLILEVEDVPAADEAIANEAYPEPLVAAQEYRCGIRRWKLLASDGKSTGVYQGCATRSA
jgi:hypothetical protein